MRLQRDDLHLLAGAYALDVLDTNAERDRFARHLHRCQDCATEVRGMREVGTALGFAAALAPPPAMRETVLAAVARTRQLPPAADRHRGPATKRAWIPRLGYAVAAAGIAAAVALGALQSSTEHELNAVRARNQAITAVLTAPDARILTQPTSAGGAATVVVSAARHKLVVLTAGLPALPAQQVYELWLIGPPGTRPAGLLLAASAGRTGAPRSAGFVPGDKLGLTVEPAGGTKQPTTAPIVLLPLPR